MPTIEIDYTVLEGKIYTHLANRTNRTAKEYVEWVLKEHAKGQIKGYFAAKLRNLTVPELIELFGDIETGDSD
jgi:hypothetical protein